MQGSIPPTGFQSVTRHLPSTEGLIDDIPDLERRVSELVIAVDAGKWESDCFTELEVFPQVALEALRIGRISRRTFSTICRYYTAYSCNNGKRPEIIRFDDGKGQFILDQQSQPYWKPNVAKVFDAAISLEEPCQQALFLIDHSFPLAQMPKKKGPRIETPFTRILFQKIQWNLFGRILNKKKPCRIIPTIGAVECAIMALFGKAHAVRVEGVLGLSTDEAMLTTETREVMDHYPKIKHPWRADGYLAPPDEFDEHDRYHAFSQASLTVGQRHLLNEMYHVCKHVRALAFSQRDQLLLDQTLKLLTDREYLLFAFAADGSRLSPEEQAAAFIRGTNEKLHPLIEHLNHSLLDGLMQGWAKIPMPPIEEATVYQLASEDENSYAGKLAKHLGHLERL